MELRWRDDPIDVAVEFEVKGFRRRVSHGWKLDDKTQIMHEGRGREMRMYGIFPVRSPASGLWGSWNRRNVETGYYERETEH